MSYYRIIYKEILADKLSEEDALTAFAMYKEQGKQNIDIEEDTVSKKKDNIKDINNGRE